MKIDIYNSKEDAFVDACNLVLNICDAGFVAEVKEGGVSAYGSRRFIVSEATTPKGNGHEISFEYMERDTDDVMTKKTGNIVSVKMISENQNETPSEQDPF